MPVVGSMTAEVMKRPGNAFAMAWTGSGLPASMVTMARSMPASSICRSSSSRGVGSKISCSRLK